MIHDLDTMQVLVHDVHTRGLTSYSYSADHDAQERCVHLLRLGTTSTKSTAPYGKGRPAAS
jgi:hypothetical protein